MDLKHAENLSATALVLLFLLTNSMNFLLSPHTYEFLVCGAKKKTPFTAYYQIHGLLLQIFYTFFHIFPNMYNVKIYTM